LVMRLRFVALLLLCMQAYGATTLPRAGEAAGGGDGGGDGGGGEGGGGDGGGGDGGGGNTSSASVYNTQVTPPAVCSDNVKDNVNDVTLKNNFGFEIRMSEDFYEKIDTKPTLGDFDEITAQLINKNIFDAGAKWRTAQNGDGEEGGATWRDIIESITYKATERLIDWFANNGRLLEDVEWFLKEVVTPIPLVLKNTGNTKASFYYSGNCGGGCMVSETPFEQVASLLDFPSQLLQMYAHVLHTTMTPPYVPTVPTSFSQNQESALKALNAAYTAWLAKCSWGKDWNPAMQETFNCSAGHHRDHLAPSGEIRHHNLLGSPSIAEYFAYHTEIYFKDAATRNWDAQKLKEFDPNGVAAMEAMWLTAVPNIVVDTGDDPLSDPLSGGGAAEAQRQEHRQEWKKAMAQCQNSTSSSTGSSSTGSSSTGCSHQAVVAACKTARGAYGWTCDPAGQADLRDRLGPAFCGPDTTWNATAKHCTAQLVPV